MISKLTTATAAILGTAFISICSFAQGITTPRTPSPASSVSQTIGISTVTVKYSRPSVKGREIWGSLVPYGWTKQGFGNNKEAPWRAGANENTVIEFSHPAKVEGQMVPAGSYGLFIAVNKDNTADLILSKDYKSWGSFWYNDKNDQMRAKINTRTIPNTEFLTYSFNNLTKNSGELDLDWEKKQFPIKIEFDVDKLVMENAAEELKGQVGFTWQGYTSAATYALQNKAYLDKALEWSEAAVTRNKNFTTLRLKSDVLEAMNKPQEAEAARKQAGDLATEGELNTYGYQLLNQGQSDKAIEILTLNTQKFPKSANAWDSLGEAYFTKGDKKNAAVYFKKSLSSNPSDATKANSERYLKQMGMM